MVVRLGDYFWGRSPVYQAVLYGYGMHTFSHLASAALARRYTPGVATALGGAYLMTTGRSGGRRREVKRP
ncbi:HXXEE domain-containing protein [Actinomyces oris]